MFCVVFQTALRWYLVCASRRYTERSALCSCTEASLRGKRELGQLQKEPRVTPSCSFLSPFLLSEHENLNW